MGADKRRKQDLWQEIGQCISAATGARLDSARVKPVGGGCISEAFELAGERATYFIKLNSIDRLPMFEAEAAGLEAINASQSLRAPEPVASGVNCGHSWLALEFIEFSTADENSNRLLGRGLAAMHRCSAGDFGWDRDNTIGATPQPNTRAPDWVSFLREQRLGFQLSLAECNRAPARLISGGRLLMERLDDFFDTYQPQSSLLHGDLWGGNWSPDATGLPVIFDPATYFGDREADLAMTELFGGFERGFYDAYREAWPMDPGYRIRREIYQLYHIINHYNLFGGGYGRQALAMTERLLAESTA